MKQAPRAHLADRLKLLVFFVVAGQQEAAVGPGPFSFPQIGADHTKIHGVPHPIQVVLLQLGAEHRKRSG